MYKLHINFNYRAWVQTYRMQICDGPSLPEPIMR